MSDSRTTQPATKTCAACGGAFITKYTDKLYCSVAKCQRDRHLAARKKREAK